MNELETELRRLYADASKHSAYQNVPDFVSAELGYTETIDEGWRGDRPRLAYLTAHGAPAAGETWLDFGANTGFFTLSLAHDFPRSAFIAVEANPNHARFIERVAQYFQMRNVEVIQRAVGLLDLHMLPHADCMLHLNVLHHAGHDFDGPLVPRIQAFPQYAEQYLGRLRQCTERMLFQMGSNWGGNKQWPLIAATEDTGKLAMLSGWLRSAGWQITSVAYATHGPSDKVNYWDVPTAIRQSVTEVDTLDRPLLTHVFDRRGLDDFPGEFYRRPLFNCQNGFGAHCR